MIDLEAARGLLNFGSRIGEGHRAEEQLRGAVAIHNILRKHRLAYLADEVGMGKTYVALGALALFRHFEPNFRVLILAPRENIQRKWQKELRNFAAHNVRFADMRMAAIDQRPARPLVSCANLLELVRQTSLDPNRDFFARMSSFSLALRPNVEDWQRQRDALRHHLPWLRDEIFDLRNKEQFKRNFARALCCSLPKFDLVIVDEAHNFKHGFTGATSARNKVLGEVFGRYDGEPPNARLFPGYGPRAERVLLLSATPLEESYRHVWNQLDLFGLAAGFEELKADDVPESTKKKVAAKFLVRRVTTIRVGEREMTKNMYRREWRAGGVAAHDEPIRIDDPRQRLVVALVQKKVSELLSGKRFNRSFQVGMLASFESFLETAGLKREDDAVFDDAEQTEVTAEREGVDVHDLNRLARDYRKTFGSEMPHPKMDALVDELALAWVTGNKSLVFVRRVASVKELKRKLDDRYDAWLTETLRGRLPELLRPEFDQLVERYRVEKETISASRRSIVAPVDVVDKELEQDDGGGHDTFFAWFFRGEGPKATFSAANLQARFGRSSASAQATFFNDNYVMELLHAESGKVVATLATQTALSTQEAVIEVCTRAALYLSRAKHPPRGARAEAAQAAALELLRERAGQPLADRAAIILEERYGGARLREHAKVAPAEIADALEHGTFFTELRRPERVRLRGLIWPDTTRSASDLDDYRRSFRDRELRAQFLSAAARLGHAAIDLYATAVASRASLATKRGEDIEAIDREASPAAHRDRFVTDYLDLLDAQRDAQPPCWGALQELAAISENFELILDVNKPELRNAPSGEATRYVGNLLRQQQPVGGMAGQVNQTMVRQFRMPGYPFVLITTDLLQEGEDLHTFCSSVFHYGISWTPSAMEQRIGRIDRVRSQTDRRLTSLEREPTGEELLQVYFPYLRETVEVLQVERVLERMGTFLRLMHEGLANPVADQRRIDVQRELTSSRRHEPTSMEPLKTAFPVPNWALQGSKKTLAVALTAAAEVRRRFQGLRELSFASVSVQWSPHAPENSLLGTAHLASGRIQPFMLVLRSDHGCPVVRCVSPIGRTDHEQNVIEVARIAADIHSRVGAIPTSKERSFDLTVEDDVLLALEAHDGARVGLLVRRVVEQADRFEREHFEDERDAPLGHFEGDLKEEVGDHE